METILDPQHAGILLACLVVGICLNFAAFIGWVLWQVLRKKTDGYDMLAPRITAMERDMGEILKFKNDFNKLFSALKYLAGDKWPKIREKLKQDHLP